MPACWGLALRCPNAPIFPPCSAFNCASSSCEVIVADGGSQDATARRAAQAGARVVPSPRGRGRQMNAGAAQAKGDILLFLHADSQLPQRCGGCVVVATTPPTPAACKHPLLPSVSIRPCLTRGSLVHRQPCHAAGMMSCWTQRYSTTSNATDGPRSGVLLRASPSTGPSSRPGSCAMPSRCAHGCGTFPTATRRSSYGGLPLMTRLGATGSSPCWRM